MTVLSVLAVDEVDSPTVGQCQILHRWNHVLVSPAIQVDNQLRWNEVHWLAKAEVMFASPYVHTTGS